MPARSGRQHEAAPDTEEKPVIENDVGLKSENAPSVGESVETVSTGGATDHQAHKCTNCGEPAVWRTTNPGADTVYFCDADRPPGMGGESLERIDG